MATRGNKLRDIDYTLSDLEKDVDFCKKTLSNKISLICEEAGIESYKIRSNESEKGDYILLFEWYELLKLLIEFQKENPFGRANPSKNKKIEDIELYYEKIFARINELPKYIKDDIEANKYYIENKKLPKSMRKLIEKISELISAIFLIASDEQVEFMDYISKSIDVWINNLYFNRNALKVAMKDYAKVCGYEYTDLKFYSIIDLLMEYLKEMVDEYNFESIESKKIGYDSILEDLLPNVNIEDKRKIFSDMLQENFYNEFELDDEEEKGLNEVLTEMNKEKREKDFTSIKKEMLINTKNDIEILKRKLQLIEQSSNIDELVDVTVRGFNYRGKDFDEFKKKVKENTYKYSEDVNKFIVSIVTNNYIK